MEVQIQGRLTDLRAAEAAGELLQSRCYTQRTISHVTLQVELAPLPPSLSLRAGFDSERLLIVPPLAARDERLFK